MERLTFKTSGDCRIELVAHTSFPSEGVEQGGWDESDWLPVSAARASFGKEDKTGNDEVADRKLMKFLADHRHVSCFEHNYATFLVECPLFVRSQIHRHTSFKFNEVSRRYTSEDIAFWVPDKWRAQSKSNKQCSAEETVDLIPTRGSRVFVKTENGIRMEKQKNSPSWFYEVSIREALETYNEMIDGGVAREQARAVLPQSLLTRFYMTGNLRSFWSFLSSRLKPDTQWETRVVAQRIEKELRNLWPESTSAFFNWSNE